MFTEEQSNNSVNKQPVSGTINRRDFLKWLGSFLVSTVGLSVLTGSNSRAAEGFKETGSKVGGDPAGSAGSEVGTVSGVGEAAAGSEGRADVTAGELAIPRELSIAIKDEFGEIAGISTWREMMADLESRKFICLGENHYIRDERIVQRKIIQEIRQFLPEVPLVVGLEYFDQKLQPKLDHLKDLPHEEGISYLREEIFTDQGYVQRDTIPEVSRLLSLDQFIETVEWCVNAGIPLIGLEDKSISLAPPSGQSDGVLIFNTENIDKFSHDRSNSWFRHFLTVKPTMAHGTKFIFLGGFDHFDTLDPESFNGLLRSNFPPEETVSVGLGRLPAEGVPGKVKAEEVAGKYGKVPLILKAPQYIGFYQSPEGEMIPDVASADYWLPLAAKEDLSPLPLRLVRAGGNSHNITLAGV